MRTNLVGLTGLSALVTALTAACATEDGVDTDTGPAETVEQDATKAAKPCTPGQVFVQGASIKGKTTWDKCEVVLLESATVPKGSTLTIRPGVTVKGNFIVDPTNQGSGFGVVTLNIEGVLKVAGTKEKPVTFTSLKEDRGWGGIVIKSKGNSMKNVVIENAYIGVDILNGGGIHVTDAVIESRELGNDGSWAGIHAQQDVEATFERTLVKGFYDGLYLENAEKFVMEDSVIRNNYVGVQIDGANQDTSCKAAPAPPPSRWLDPVITHTDIVENSRQGVVISGSDVFIQISKSNLVNNGEEALVIEGAALAPKSFFRENNVYNNNVDQKGAEVRTVHHDGTIDISQNYWKEISDPELSANWARQCNGQITFTGFSPTLIRDAGPRAQASLPAAVKNGCFKHAAK